MSRNYKGEKKKGKPKKQNQKPNKTKQKNPQTEQLQAPLVCLDVQMCSSE